MRKLLKRLEFVHEFLEDEYKFLFLWDSEEKDEIMEKFCADPDLDEEERRSCAFEDENLLLKCAKACQKARYFVLLAVDVTNDSPEKDKWLKVIHTLIETRIMFEDMARSVCSGYYFDQTKEEFENMIACVESVMALLKDMVSQKVKRGLLY